MKIKKNLVLTILLSLLALDCISINNTRIQTLFLPKDHSTQEAIKKYFKHHKPILLWDLHQVVFQKKMGRMFSYTRPDNANLPSRFTVYKEFIQSLFSPTTYKNMYHQMKIKNKVVQAYFDTFANRPALYGALLRMANDIHVPTPAVGNILERLKKSGHKQFILSNIGPAILQDLQSQYPDVFIHFDRKENSINNQIPHVGTWLHKPNLSAYQKAILWTDAPAAQHIFIDDKLENVKGAQEAGITGILFINAEQLLTDLQAIGVDI